MIGAYGFGVWMSQTLIVRSRPPEKRSDGCGLASEAREVRRCVVAHSSQSGYSRKRQTLYVIPMDADQLGLIVFLAVVWLPCTDGSVGGGGDDCGRAELVQGGKLGEEEETGRSRERRKRGKRTYQFVRC